MENDNSVESTTEKTLTKAEQARLAKLAKEQAEKEKAEKLALTAKPELTADELKSVPFTIAGDDVLNIANVDFDNPYQNGKKAEKQRTYNRYSYLVDGRDVVFQVDTTNPFCQDFEDGNVEQVNLSRSNRVVEFKKTDGETGLDIISYEKRPTLNFHNHISLNKIKSREEREEQKALHNAKMSMISRVAEKADLTQETVNQILKVQV